MRQLLFFTACLLFSLGTYAESTVQTGAVDTLLNTLYQVISGPPGERNWTVFRSLFHPNAIMGTIRIDSSGNQLFRTFTPAEYIQNNGPIMEKTGFYESETAREVIEMKDMMLIKSTYEWTSGNRSDKGVNAMVLLRVEHQWRFYSLFWQSL